MKPSAPALSGVYHYQAPPTLVHARLPRATLANSGITGYMVVCGWFDVLEKQMTSTDIAAILDPVLAASGGAPVVPVLPMVSWLKQQIAGYDRRIMFPWEDEASFGRYFANLRLVAQYMKAHGMAQVIGYSELASNKGTAQGKEVAFPKSKDPDLPRRRGRQWAACFRDSGIQIGNLTMHGWLKNNPGYQPFWKGVGPDFVVLMDTYPVPVGKPQLGELRTFYGGAQIVFGLAVAKDPSTVARWTSPASLKTLKQWYQACGAAMVFSGDMQGDAQPGTFLMDDPAQRAAVVSGLKAMQG